MNVFDEFQWRGMVYDATEGLSELLAKESVTAYIGFDPTASSLHVGSLLTVMGLARLQRFGHTPIAIVGGGTGMIGDPKPTQERPLLDREEIERNVQGIKAQLMRFLDFDRAKNAALLVNNADWLASFGVLDFLRDTGKYFTVNYLLQKEAVNRRLETEEGISFTEFSYPLLQARDYLELFDRHGCMLQMGGSDQWGNITAGIELVRKLRSKRVHGLVWPLMKTAAGTKFGKTEQGTVWLDAARTPPFQFYQFWLNTQDSDVVTYLRCFTFLDRATIESLEAVTKSAPEKREAQRVLAREVTALVHGADEAARAAQGSERLFAGLSSEQSAEDVLAALADVPSTSVPASVLAAERPLAQWLVDTKLVTSKSEAARLIRGGGIYVNDVAVTDEKMRLGLKDLWQQTLIVLGKGKRQKHVLKLTE